jgi:hypothetical protein
MKVYLEQENDDVTVSKRKLLRLKILDRGQSGLKRRHCEYQATCSESDFIGRNAQRIMPPWG